MTEGPGGEKPGRRLVVGCFLVALLILAALTVYIVVGHLSAVGPYKQPPEARP